MVEINRILQQYFERIDNINSNGKLDAEEIRSAQKDNSIFSAILKENMTVESFTESFQQTYGEIKMDLPSDPQDWDWDVITRVLSRDEVDKDCFNIKTKEGTPVSSKLDFNNEAGQYMLRHLSFDFETFKNTPSQNLPEGWNPETVIENGFQLGQNVDKMHEMGYTGKGINVAVLDTPIIIHNDIKSSLKSYIVMDDVKELNLPADFHGQATSDILCGDKSGAAPDAKLTFIATGNNKLEWLKGLREIIDYNQKAELQDKIKVISLSWGFEEGEEGYDEFRAILKELYDDGVFVATADFNMLDESLSGTCLSYGCISKKDQMRNPNDFSNYVARDMYGNSNPENTLYVVSGDRTVASAKNPDKFRHDSQLSTSWTTPALAGIYTCALQCAEENGIELTPAKFWQWALESGVPVNDSSGATAGKAIDAEALCKKIIEMGREEHTFGL